MSESWLVDHNDGKTLESEVKAGKTDSIACNVLALWKEFYDKLDKLSSELELIKERITTLEGLI